MYMIASVSRPAGVRRACSQRGFTMLEVLVALLILLIGLLGLAGLLVTIQQGEVEAYQRKQAAVLLQDMIGRLTGNATSASCYVTTTGVGDTWQGTDKTAADIRDCGVGTGRDRAKADLIAWNDALLGISEKSAANLNVGGIIEARGCVNFNAVTGVYTVSVAWRGMQPTVAPAAACAKDMYDANATDLDRRRRVISVDVRIANLSG
jgi:type IV pilus assembly protein PilV